MEKKLFDSIIADVKSDEFFKNYKFRKSDNDLYYSAHGECIMVNFHHYRDFDYPDESCVIELIYGKRFNVLTKWFEKFSVMPLSSQRTNPDFRIFGYEFGDEKEITFKYNFSDYDYKLQRMLIQLKKNISKMEETYATMTDYYNADVKPILQGEKKFQDIGAVWIFIDMALTYLVDKDNYPKFKKMMFEHIEWMYKRHEPNVEDYYGRFEEIFTYMENNLRLPTSK